MKFSHARKALVAAIGVRYSKAEPGRFDSSAVHVTKNNGLIRRPGSILKVSNGDSVAAHVTWKSRSIP